MRVCDDIRSVPGDEIRDNINIRVLLILAKALVLALTFWKTTIFVVELSSPINENFAVLIRWIGCAL